LSTVEHQKVDLSAAEQRLGRSIKGGAELDSGQSRPGQPREQQQKPDKQRRARRAKQAAQASGLEAAWRRPTSKEIGRRRSSEIKHGPSEEFQPDAVCWAVLTRLEPGGCHVGGASFGQEATARSEATRTKSSSFGRQKGRRAHLFWIDHPEANLIYFGFQERFFCLAPCFCTWLARSDHCILQIGECVR
jgi:hypothetical protein